MSIEVGSGTIIWHKEKSNIYGSGYIGENCNIGAMVEIRSPRIGNNCKIQAFVFIPEGVVIGNNVFIGPHVCFCNDKYPKVTEDWKLSKTVVEDNVSLGANVTVLPGLVIGAGSMVGAGSVVTKNIPPNSLVYGNPAKVIKPLEKRQVFIFGHRRSGNHFLAEVLKLNFNIQFDQDLHKSHDLYEEYISKAEVPKNSLYVVRDGRDVLVSCYYWWKLSKGSKELFSKLTFSDYLRGIAKSDLIKYGMTYHDLGLWMDPIGYWIKHVRSWMHKATFIKYEDLKLNLKSVLIKISDTFNWPFVMERYVPELVGHAPRKGIIGDWRNHFSESDLTLFMDKAFDLMKELKYV